jgi:dihydroneopterin aldolase
MASSIEITLRNMRFHVRVGVLPHEAEFAQPLEIDLTVWTAPAAQGQIGVDYRDLHTVASDVVSRGPLLYLETIAQRIVAGALERPNVIGARAAVRKPHVALPGPLDHAEVVVEDGRRA